MQASGLIITLYKHYGRFSTTRRISEVKIPSDNLDFRYFLKIYITQYKYITQ